MRFALLLMLTGCVPLGLTSRHLDVVGVAGLPQSSLSLEINKQAGVTRAELSLGWSSGNCYALNGDVQVTAGKLEPTSSETAATTWTPVRHAAPLLEESCTNGAEWTFSYRGTAPLRPRQFSVADAKQTIALLVEDPFAVDCRLVTGERGTARRGERVPLLCNGNIKLEQATLLPRSRRDGWKRSDIESGTFRVPDNLEAGTAQLEISGTLPVQGCIGAALGCHARFRRTLELDVTL
jgi:hypothetical protein